MSGLFWLWHFAGSGWPTIILTLILAADIFVWWSTKQLLARRKPANGALIDRAMRLLGSWPSLLFMGFGSIGWFLVDLHSRHSTDTLDMVISIWTMLMDVMVIISMNYMHQREKHDVHL